MTWRGSLVLVLGVAALSAVGCGGSMPASVRGTVTLDGKPLETGNVAFHPDSEGPLAYGTIDSSGTYELSTGTEQGIVPGSYTATVVATEPIQISTGNEAPKAPRPITPAKYNDAKTSDLKFTVKAGSNTIPLELKSQ